MSVGGGFGGYSASLSVNVETFKESMNQNTKFGSSKKVYKSGGPDMPSPIRIKLEPIYNALRAAFFKKHLQQQPNCNFNVQSLSQLKNNIEKLFKAYPQLKGAEKGQGRHILSSKQMICEEIDDILKSSISIKMLIIGLPIIYLACCCCFFYFTNITEQPQ